MFMHTCVKIKTKMEENLDQRLSALQELGPGGFIGPGPHESRSQNVRTVVGDISQLARLFKRPI